MLLDESEPHLGTSAKMPMAFLARRAPSAPLELAPQFGIPLGKVGRRWGRRFCGRDRSRRLPGTRASGIAVVGRPPMPQYRGLDAQFRRDPRKRSPTALQEDDSLTLELRGELPSCFRCHRITCLAPQERIRGVHPDREGSVITLLRHPDRAHRLGRRLALRQ